MKSIITTIILSSFFLTASAASTIDLQGTQFRADTVEHYYVGPGITQTHLRLTNLSRVVEVYYSTLDKNDATYSPIAQPRVEIGLDRCLTAEKVTSMAARKTTADRQILTGVNGDFFITSSFAQNHEFGNAILGYPNMSCVIDGKIAAPDMIDITSRENALVIGSDGMWIDATDLTYKLLNNDGSTQVKAKAVNYPRRDNEIMVYNSYMGATTSTAAGGREIALELADGSSWKVNSSVSFIVSGDWSTSGNMTIPKNGIVISCGQNYSNEWVDGLKAGDKVKLKIILSLPAFGGIKPDVQHVVGGDVRILKEGTVTTEAIRWINTPSAKYARSLAGYSEDRSKLVMAAVDGGGATGSTGLTYYESADLMKALGCYDALDLDGGGSTMIWNSAKGIVNKPRDGSERAVGNALFFAIDAPADKTVASIRFEDHAVTLPRFAIYKPVVYGYNKYGQLIDTNITGFTLETGAGLDNHGDYVIAESTGLHILKARYGALEAEVAVNVDGTSPAEAVNENILIDGARKVVPVIRSLADGEYREIPANIFEWTSSNSDVVTVDANSGEISGKATGEAVVTGKRGDTEVSVNVKVEISPSGFIALDDNLGDDSWKVTLSGISTDWTVTPIAGGWNLNYETTKKRSLKITFAKSITAYSLPDRLGVEIESDGTTFSAITMLVEANGTKKPVTLSPQSSAAEGGMLVYNMSDAFDVSEIAYYPVLFRSFTINPNPKDNDTKSSINIKGLGFYYDNFEASVDNIAIRDNAGPSILLNGTLIYGSADVNCIELIGLDGRVVARAMSNCLKIDQFHGMFIVRAIADGAVKSIKIRL